MYIYVINILTYELGFVLMTEVDNPTTGKPNIHYSSQIGYKNKINLSSPAETNCRPIKSNKLLR
jgi:hypothetical protein